MAKRVVTLPNLLVPLDAASATPLYRQLYQGLREAILNGRLAAGTRLPSTRTLAEELGLSRNTVANAFEQLLAEGYVEGRVGAGTYVASLLPEELLSPAEQGSGEVATARPARALSRRGELLARTPVTRAGRPDGLIPFRAGLPALERFPFKLWERISGRLWRSYWPVRWQELGYGAPAGYRQLREALASYLAAARGVRCQPEQVIVISGSQQALDLAARVLLDPGERAAVEDPGYLGARGALIAAGAQLAPIPVDQDGLVVEALAGSAGPLRLVYVTPSHQFPLGMTMSLPRRLALLEWARSHDAWVLEDDYDSEYRYASRPLTALQGLDEDGRVIYLGSLSKVMFPGLRLGYMVAPPDLVDAFVAARALVDRQPPAIEQVVLAEFIQEGHFARHLRQMRALYAERQALLLDAAGRELGGALRLEPAEAGMHLVGWLPQGADDRAAARQALAHGVIAAPLSDYAMHEARPGLLLGYSAFDERAIRQGVARLAAAFEA